MSNNITSMPATSARAAAPLQRSTDETRVPKAVYDRFWQTDCRLTYKGTIYADKAINLFRNHAELQTGLHREYDKYVRAYEASRTGISTATHPPLAASQPSFSNIARIGLQQRPSTPSLLQIATNNDAAQASQRARNSPQPQYPATAALHQAATAPAPSASQQREVIDLTQDEDEDPASAVNGGKRPSTPVDVASANNGAPPGRKWCCGYYTDFDWLKDCLQCGKPFGDASTHVPDHVDAVRKKSKSRLEIPEVVWQGTTLNSKISVYPQHTMPTGSKINPVVPNGAVARYNGTTSKLLKATTQHPPSAQGSARRVTEVPGDLPHGQPTLVTPQHRLASGMAAGTSTFRVSDSTAQAKPGKRKRPAQSENDECDTGSKKAKIWELHCDYCGRGYDYRGLGNIVHCTQCCNKSKASGYCMWEAARVVLPKWIDEGVEVSSVHYSTIHDRSRACQASKEQSGWCECSISATVKAAFAGTSAPNGSYFDLRTRYPRVPPSPTAFEMPSPSDSTSHNRVPAPLPRSTGLTTSVVSMHDLPSLSHSTASSPVFTPSTASPQTPSANYELYVSRVGPSKQAYSLPEAPKQSQSKKRNISSIIDLDEVGTNEPARKVAKLSSTRRVIPQQKIVAPPLNLESLVAQHGSLIAAEEALTAMPGFVSAPIPKYEPKWPALPTTVFPDVYETFPDEVKAGYEPSGHIFGSYPPRPSMYSCAKLKMPELGFYHTGRQSEFGYHFGEDISGCKACAKMAVPDFEEAKRIHDRHMGRPQGE
ncbi:hypothetical protein LTR85_004645 [Meristemomyces frigidus]|nr:hypothetical protein LTR85_004645 [Meristemomyces frigidus]